jgi:hypothetical protein
MAVGSVALDGGQRIVKVLGNGNGGGVGVANACWRRDAAWGEVGAITALEGVGGGGGGGGGAAVVVAGADDVDGCGGGGSGSGSGRSVVVAAVCAVGDTGEEAAARIRLDACCVPSIAMLSSLS